MKKLFIFIQLISIASLFAQDAFKNHQKYWYYRSRLRNDFMKVGLKQGESIPFAQRGYGSKVDENNPKTCTYKTGLKIKS